ncbi:Cadmium, cobalt and zinc/H(+)-K(+) antiporter [Microbulbifer aggregans]|uniref:Cadmium, cobalt and zinc/H(+)-K(+) antiporter n=1 Tax=Microbulbifer aggregans TaxID=1769779 RepID=A0A1C9W9S5_9GAMM|nr:cation diffusion facilitator family transporter [Microbulbifer aggregans]AOS97843.1 Cadmium, cobalt and zinc/H(+)-K(+) antiporter [Microbulbifer aggregans]
MEEKRMERNTLVALLSINAVMFLLELVLGLIAHSTGLLADSLDMLADAFVYGLSLYAVGKAVTKKVSAARVSGYLQILLGMGVLFEVLRRLVYGSEPQSTLMIVVGIVALLANVVCVGIIAKHRGGGVHMRASWIFSVNDVLANLGVILSGCLVEITGSRYPDLTIGMIIAALVVRGGLQILREAREAGKPAQNP